MCRNKRRLIGSSATRSLAWVERARLHTRGADPGYVEQKLGREFYSQLAGMSAVADSRRAAVLRAFSLYKKSVSSESPEPEITGLGLLVLQRTLLACEDLGALIHGLVGKPHWLRFTSYRLGDLDQTFVKARDGQVDVAKLWSMPTDESIADEPGRTDEQRRALRRLREVSIEALEQELRTVAEFWMSHRESIKNVMHGFSLVPAVHLIEPPGAGVLSKQVDLTTDRPFAASLVSELDDKTRTVTTTTYTLDLTPPGIEIVRDISDTACELMNRLSEARLYAVRTKHAFVIRNDFTDLLDPADRATLAELMAVDGA